MHRNRLTRLTTPRLKAFLSLCMLAFGCSVNHADTSFPKVIAPIIVKNCIACHGERTALGGYRMHTIEAMLRPGASGKLPIKALNPNRSMVYQRMNHTNVTLRMPQGGDPMSAQDLSAVRLWILNGASVEGMDVKGSLVKLLGSRTHASSPSAYSAPPSLSAVTFSPDSTRIATGGYREVLIWNRATGHLVQRVSGLPDRIRALVWHPDGKQVVVAGGIPGEYGEVAVADIATGKRSRVLTTMSDLATSVSFSPDATKVVMGCADASVACVDFSKGSLLWTSKVHTDQITGVMFSSDSTFVASTGRDKVVKVYDAATGILFTTYNGHKRNNGEYRGQDPVFGILPVPNHPDFMTVGGGKWILRWNPEKAKSETGDAGDMETRFFTQGHTKYTKHDLSGDVLTVALVGEIAYCAGEAGTIMRVPLNNSKASIIGQQTDWIFGLAASPDGNWLAAVGSMGTVQLIDIRGTVQDKSWIAAPVAPRGGPKQRSKQK